MAELKIGRNTYDINEKDRLLFNGAVWQITTRTVFDGWYEYYPIVSKTLCQRLLKKGILILVKKEKEYVATNGQQMGLYYYKFDMDKLNEFVNK